MIWTIEARCLDGAWVRQGCLRGEPCEHLEAYAKQVAKELNVYAEGTGVEFRAVPLDCRLSEATVKT